MTAKSPRPAKGRWPARPTGASVGPVEVRAAGDRAMVIDVETTAQAATLAAACAEHPLPGQVDAVCGARSVLLIFDRPPRPHQVTRGVSQMLSTPNGQTPSGSHAKHVIEVVYDGEDLDEVAQMTGLGRDAVIAAHTGMPWTVGFGGFAPGFAYLIDGDPALEVARRSASRPRVPAGAVGLAGMHSGVYPCSSPGGWQLIGRTAARLWDVERTPAALLAPGDQVRFAAVDAFDPAPAADERSGGAASSHAPAQPALEIEGVGLQALVVDAGRPGMAAAGVPRSGPMDRTALMVANTAVGNPAWTAAVEVTGGGLRVRARGQVVRSVTGATVGLVVTTREGVVRHRRCGQVFALREGEAMEIGVPERGLRSYLAVRGGLDVPAVLGSRCTDSLCGLGPPALARGDVLPVGDQPAAAVAAPSVLPGVDDHDSPCVLHVVAGPRQDWFDASALSALLAQDWEIGARSDRVGLRLSAERPLVRGRAGELPTEGVATGSLQASPDGDLVLFAADHPVTGGYPVIAVVIDADLDQVAQLRPGGHVRFRLASPAVIMVAPSPTSPDGAVPRAADHTEEERCAPS